MMGSDLFFRDKIPVVVLGVTGKMGGKLIQKLSQHPWFQIVALCDDFRNVEGWSYGQAISESFSLPQSIQNLLLHSSEVPLPVPLVFSSLQVIEGALWKEKLWAESGAYVISSSLQREAESIPLIIPEVNSDYLAPLSLKGSQGSIIATPHPLVSGLTLALKPLLDRYGIEAVQVKASGLDHDERGEDENKEMGQQILYLLGNLEKGQVKQASFEISFGGNLVRGGEGGISVAIKLKKRAELEEVIQSWLHFRSGAERLTLPSAFYHPLFYRSESLAVPSAYETAVYLEDIQPFLPMDFTFKLCLLDPFQEGVASLLLNAELLVANGLIYW